MCYLKGINPETTDLKELDYMGSLGRTELLKEMFCVKHSGKMEDMQSMSTAMWLNEFCLRNKEIIGSVCQKCYVEAQKDRYKDFSIKLERNNFILKNYSFKLQDMPLLNVLYFRFEAFGDLENEIQISNYFLLAKKNKGVHFSLFTKNYNLINNYLKNHKMPNNINLVISSLMINEKINIDKLEYVKPYKPTIFTVYSSDYALQNNININCGAKFCLGCNKCYHKNTDREINEMLKQESKKYYKKLEK